MAQLIDNSLSWKTRSHVFYMANNMAADDLVTQGARASTAMVLIYLSQNIPVSAPEGLMSVIGKKMETVNFKEWKKIDYSSGIPIFLIQFS